jgi:tryptophan synthase alpha chain|tara:strand:- start:602 stop:1417 length:816 start_codon:yes stop_codon:yes gene_type:complete
MSRIKITFESLKNKNKKALIPFFTAGDPHPDKTVEIMHALVESGADMIELGIPFSDPMADGPVIQRASERALKNSVGITTTIKLAKEFREKDKTTPLILMGYANPIEAIGIDYFVSIAAEAGIDGVITVDYPPEESKQFVEKLKEKNIDSIFLLSPTTDNKRIELIIKQATGFLYYVSLKGVTGSANIDIKQVAQNVQNIEKFTKLPIAVGFGVRDAKTAQQVSSISDAVVIGSRIVQEIENSNDIDLIGNIKNLIVEMRNSIDKDGVNEK